MKLKEALAQRPLTLALSAGYFGFFAHLGFMDVLIEEKIQVRKISGASAGALVAGIIGSGMPIEDAVNTITEIPIQDIWDPGLGWGYLKWSKLEGILSQHLRPRLEDLDIKIAVSVLEIRSMKTKVFTEGPAPAIIRASCSPPVLAHPARIGDQLYFDGGVFDKVASRGIPKDEAFISHFLLSHSFDRKIEFWWALKSRRQNQIIMSFDDLVQVKPHALQKGKEAFERARDRSAKILNKEIRNLGAGDGFYGELKSLGYQI